MRLRGDRPCTHALLCFVIRGAIAFVDLLQLLHKQVPVAERQRGRDSFLSSANGIFVNRYPLL